MKRQIKLVSYITIAAIVTASALFRLDEKTLYETQEIRNGEIVKKLDFKTRIYPDYYTKIDLESKNNIIEVFVKKGDSVNEGDTLVQLDDTEEQEAYNSARNLYNQLAAYRDQIRENQASSSTNFSEIEQNLNDTQIKIEGLVEEIEQLDEETQKTITTELEKSIENAILALNGAQTTINTYDMERIVQPAVNAAYAQVEKAKEKIEERKIKAPFSGKILHIQTDKYVERQATTSGFETPDLNSLMEGMTDPTQFMSGGIDFGKSTETTNLRGENFLVISNLDKVYLYADFSEKEILEVKKDMTVDIFFENTKEQRQGQVADVTDFPLNEGSEEPRYGTVITLNEMPEKFLIGSNVSGSIKIYEKENIIAVPISAISYTDKKTAYVYQLDQRKELIKTEVVLGDENLTQVEILDGIKDGDEIVIDEDKTVRRLALRPWIKKLIQK